VHGIEGLDKKAERDLGMKGSFPVTDKALMAYMDGIGKRMKPYSGSSPPRVRR